ncbi:hypothetical protein DH09_01200 (plasmid) [Bacillaceae bacterium JMAK1]|nr:hypothetical protein DH09_01200 [Bacillaceae bacterium JMAK1]
MRTDTASKTKQGVLGPTSHAFMSVLVYGMLFVALMVATGGSITLDNLLLPIVGIYAVVGITEYLTMKRVDKAPQWLVIGSFGVGITMAVLMMAITL